MLRLSALIDRLTWIPGPVRDHLVEIVMAALLLTTLGWHGCSVKRASAREAELRTEILKETGVREGFEVTVAEVLDDIEDLRVAKDSAERELNRQLAASRAVNVRNQAVIAHLEERVESQPVAVFRPESPGVRNLEEAFDSLVYAHRDEWGLYELEVTVRADSTAEQGASMDHRVRFSPRLQIVTAQGEDGSVLGMARAIRPDGTPEPRVQPVTDRLVASEPPRERRSILGRIWGVVTHPAALIIEGVAILATVGLVVAGG